MHLSGGSPYGYPPRDGILYGNHQSGSDACTPGGMDQLHHDICGFAARLQAPPSGKGASVTGIPFTKGKQAVADRHKGVPVRPAKGEHPESTAVFHGAVVKDPCRQFHLFRAGAVKQAVVRSEERRVGKEC